MKWSEWALWFFTEGQLAVGCVILAVAIWSWLYASKKNRKIQSGYRDKVFEEWTKGNRLQSDWYLDD